MEQLLEQHNLPKLTQDEIESLNSPKKKRRRN
jgi:hypothetical protein